MRSRDQILKETIQPSPIKIVYGAVRLHGKGVVQKLKQLNKSRDQILTELVADQRKDMSSNKIRPLITVSRKIGRVDTRLCNGKKVQHAHKL